MNFASDGVYSLRSVEHKTYLYSEPLGNGNHNYLWMDQTGKLEAESTPICVYNRLNAKHGIVGIDSIRLRDYGPLKILWKLYKHGDFWWFFPILQPIKWNCWEWFGQQNYRSQSGHGQIRQSFTTQDGRALATELDKATAFYLEPMW